MVIFNIKVFEKKGRRVLLKKIKKETGIMTIINRGKYLYEIAE